MSEGAPKYSARRLLKFRSSQYARPVSGSGTVARGGGGGSGGGRLGRTDGLPTEPAPPSNPPPVVESPPRESVDPVPGGGICAGGRETAPKTITAASRAAASARTDRRTTKPRLGRGTGTRSVSHPC